MFDVLKVGMIMSKNALKKTHDNNSKWLAAYAHLDLSCKLVFQIFEFGIWNSELIKSMS